MSRPRRRHSVPAFALAVLLLLPLVAFFTLLLWQYSPLPNEDDYHALFGFALRWQHAADWLHRTQLIVAFQHNEYKMPLLYSLLSSELALTHRMHLPLWIWTGNLLVPLMLVPFWLACAREEELRTRLLYAVPIVWMLMNLNYAETVDFAVSGIQVLGVVVLSLACLYSVTRDETRWNYLGCAFALLACAIYANAFMLAPIGVLLFFREKRRVLVAWCASFALVLIAFLYRYHFLSHPHANPLKMAAFFLALVGCSFGFHGIYVPAMLGGAILLAAFAYLAREKAWKVQPFGFFTAVWLLLGFALTTYGRASNPMADALPSRYKLYDDVLLAAMYLQFLDLWRKGRLPRLRIRPAVAALALFLVLFGIYSDALGWYRLYRRQQYLRYGMTQFLESGGAISPMVYSGHPEAWMIRPVIEEEARRLLIEVRREGLYEIPGRF